MLGITLVHGELLPHVAARRQIFRDQIPIRHANVSGVAHFFKKVPCDLCLHMFAWPRRSIISSYRDHGEPRSAPEKDQHVSSTQMAAPGSHMFGGSSCHRRSQAAGRTRPEL